MSYSKAVSSPLSSANLRNNRERSRSLATRSGSSRTRRIASKAAAALADLTDIMPLLADRRALRAAIDTLAGRYRAARIDKVVSAEAMKKALPGLVPRRFLEINIRAFERGYSYGLDLLSQEKAKDAS